MHQCPMPSNNFGELSHCPNEVVGSNAVGNGKRSFMVSRPALDLALYHRHDLPHLQRDDSEGGVRVQR